MSLLGSQQGFIIFGYEHEGHVPQGVQLCTSLVKMNAVILHYTLQKRMLYSVKLPVSCSCSAIARGSLDSIVLHTTSCLTLQKSREQGPLSGHCSGDTSHSGGVRHGKQNCSECFSLITFLIKIWCVAKTENSEGMYPCLQHFSCEAGRGMELFSLLVKYFCSMWVSKSPFCQLHDDLLCKNLKFSQ